MLKNTGKILLIKKDKVNKTRKTCNYDNHEKVKSYVKFR